MLLRSILENAKACNVDNIQHRSLQSKLVAICLSDQCTGLILFVVINIRNTKYNNRKIDILVCMYVCKYIIQVNKEISKK